MKQQESSNHRSPGATLLGPLLVQGREASGLTQKQAAEKLGVTPAYLSRLENGRHGHPSPDILMAAAKLYDISMADFYAATGYIVATDLPGYRAYLCAKHPGCPEAAMVALTTYFEFIKKKFEFE